MSFLLPSPSLRGRGLKYFAALLSVLNIIVALFTRAWIEIRYFERMTGVNGVALFTRAWIEIDYKPSGKPENPVALFTRAWIEIIFANGNDLCMFVALFTRAWIEIYWGIYITAYCRSPSLRGRGLK